MRVFHILSGSVHETDTLPDHPPSEGFVWIACGRREFELEQAHIPAVFKLSVEAIECQHRSER